MITLLFTVNSNEIHTFEELLLDIPDRFVSLRENVLPNGIPENILKFYVPTYVNNYECYNHSLLYAEQLQRLNLWAFQSKYHIIQSKYIVFYFIMKFFIKI